MDFEPAPSPSPSGDGKNVAKKAAGPIAILVGILAKFKLALLPLLKFLPIILKTGGTMVLSIGVYALTWGWKFAVGFVVLILIHECGHLVAAKRLGLKAGAPVFIPFMGAFIALKDAPKNAWIEAQVGIGGPLFGALGAAACYGIYMVTGDPLYSALAYTACWLNLFNLAPVGFLDGGRIATALSPWLWVVGIIILGGLMFVQINFLLVLIFIASLPRLFSLFRRRTEEEERYFEVTPGQRLTMGALYFWLIGVLVLGMMISHVTTQR